jgi:hypothetical protein
MILHIYELHAVLKNNYFLNPLLRLEHWHDLHRLRHVVATRFAKDVDRMAVLIIDFCGGETSVSSIRRKHTRSLLYRSRKKIQSLCTDIAANYLPFARLTSDS